MRRKSRKISGRKKLKIMLFLISSLLFTVFIIRTERSIRPAAEIQAEYHSRRVSNEIISESVAEYLSENRFTYSDFAAVLYDESGDAAAIEAITYNINKAQSELTLMINSELKNAEATTAEIPLGTLTDSFLFAGKGPRIKLRICPANEATVSLTSSFESAGINQTCHRISAVITTDVSSSIPLYTFETQTDFEFLLAENIIVGDIPETAIDVWSKQ